MKTFWGVFRHEFRMHARRPAVWIVTLALGCSGLSVIAYQLGMGDLVVTLRVLGDQPVRETIGKVALHLNLYAPITYGIFLADRLVRDKKYRVHELAAASPTSLATRLAAKYAGTATAGLLPITLVLTAVAIALAVTSQSFVAIPAAALAFVAIILPGALFVAAFSLVCPLWMPVPIYQVLYTGYWVWGNMMTPDGGIPTLSSTLLTPIGGFATAGFFHAPALLFEQATPVQGALSVALLLAGAAIALHTGYRWLQKPAQAEG